MIIPAIWPDEAIAAAMLADADAVFDAAIKEEVPVDLESVVAVVNDAGRRADLACHCHALLQRVRELERELSRLRRYERAVQSLADQFCAPKITAEELVAGQLGEKVERKDRSRR